MGFGEADRKNGIMIGSLRVLTGNPKAHHGEELVGIDGLGEVVICPDFQTHDAVNIFAFGSEHDDRCAVVGCAQASADRQTVFTGHHQVEHDDATIGPMAPSAEFQSSDILITADCSASACAVSSVAIDGLFDVTEWRPLAMQASTVRKQPLQVANH